MPNYVPLSKSRHREAGLVPAGYDYALQQAVVPVAAEELPQVLPTMAVAFISNTSGDGYQLVALQSLQAGVNVYVHTNGRWIGGYRPAWYRAHPFRLMQEEQQQRTVVCIDEDSKAFEAEADDSAARLFDDEGEPTDRTRSTVKFLEQLQKATNVTQALVGQLAEAGVVVPWPLKVKPQDGGDDQEVKGLFHIDEAALKALAPDTLSLLAASGALSVAYSQLLSEHRLQGLSRLYHLRTTANRQQQTADDVDLEDLFGDDDDDDLSFNF
ncbi:SapC family protein [Marinobacter bryozoorum]|uniref:SapC family protein n=1 Tax=Marinobacter bryozoorum TaxID=256324 RepID=UPI002006C4FB|nr:SapC family protein [Marinobacter bryozoorum]MCK7542778.1 SapC family protein [Marinobacter bryozoorum]